MKGIHIELHEGGIATNISIDGMDFSELCKLIASVERTKLELIEKLDQFDDLEYSPEEAIP